MVAPRIQELAPLWESRLQELLTRFAVPGAVLGVSHRGERVLAPAGVAGLRNPQPVGADTIFQLGSISKVYTATLLMALAGPEILERPVAELVPEAGWLEPEIRVLHLLTHSSGLGGDHFADTGRGDDALARYVAQLAALPRDIPLPPGSRYSYCNSGYSVLGRLIEVLSGESYDAALRHRLLDPLGAAATVTLPEEAILHPVALGHNRHAPDPLRADDVWNFARSCNPLGGVCASAGDLLAFAELHLRDGRAVDGAPILAPGVAALMRRSHLRTPPLSRPGARGLGWGIDELDGGRELVGHDGETLGQIASLRVLPDEQLAVVVLTNAVPDGDELTGALNEAVLAAWGLTPPRIDVPVRDAAVAFDPHPYLGRYRNLESIFDVAADDHGLTVTSRTIAEGLEENTDVTRLVPLGDGAFVEADVARPTRARWFDDPDAEGRCQSYFAGRIAWRVAPAAE
jgi:CubicO group peptidase (beta-lactamase class C family)